MADAPVVPAVGGQGDPPTSPPASPPPTPEGAPSPPAPPEPAKPFYSEFKNAELRGYSEIKGFKDPEALTESYRNMEKLLGVPKDRLLHLPENIEDAEAMKPIMERLKLSPPENPDGYGFTTLEGADPEFAKVAATWMHEAGVTAAQAKMLATKQMEWQKGQNEAAERAENEEAQADMGRLQAEWNTKYNDKLESARRAMRQFGVDEDTLKSIEAHVGAAKILKLFNSIGEATSEARFIEGGGVKPGFGMTAEGAKARIAELRSDKAWLAKYVGGDKAALNEMLRLQQIAVPEMAP